MSLVSWIMRSERIFRCSASSRVNPRSRKTFPDDFRTRVAIASSSDSSPSGLEPYIAASSHLDVVRTCLPRLLFEGVQNVDRLAELGHVDDPMLDPRVHADLVRPRPDGGQGLPVARHQAG